MERQATTAVTETGAGGRLSLMVRLMPAPGALGADLGTTHLRGMAKRDGQLVMLLDLASALAAGR